MAVSSPPTVTISPRQLATLYYRCIRCLYDHAHAAGDRLVHASTFRETAIESMKAVQGPDGWIEIPGAGPVRIVSHSVRPDSEPIPFPEFGIQLVFAPHPAALLEFKDGKTILCAYRQREANAALRSVLRCSLEGAAFAAEHAADPADTLPGIDGLGIVEFSMKLVPARKGTTQRAFRPARLIELKREPERFAMFLRVVARILAGSKAPPPNPDCQQCIGSRAGDKVPA